MCNLYISIEQFNCINQLALLPSTIACIPLINMPPIAVAPCAIAHTGIALFCLLLGSLFMFSLGDVTGSMLDRSAGNVLFIFLSILALIFNIMSILTNSQYEKFGIIADGVHHHLFMCHLVMDLDLKLYKYRNWCNVESWVFLLQISHM